MAADEKHLLIGRINGKSASRRQRAFKDAEHTANAILRWEAEGFNGFWVYGPRLYSPNDTGGSRGCIGSFHREQDEEREVVISRLLGMGTAVSCDKCHRWYDEDCGDGYMGLCPSCADKAYAKETS